MPWGLLPAQSPPQGRRPVVEVTALPPLSSNSPPTVPPKTIRGYHTLPGEYRGGCEICNSEDTPMMWEKAPLHTPNRTRLTHKL